MSERTLAESVRELAQRDRIDRESVDWLLVADRVAAIERERDELAAAARKALTLARTLTKYCPTRAARSAIRESIRKIAATVGGFEVARRTPTEQEEPDAE